MFTSSRTDNGRYEYVLVHVSRDEAIEYKEDGVESLEIRDDSSMFLRHPGGGVSFYKDFLYVEYKERNLN